jgi:serine/threonine-protein kinase
MGPTPEGMLYHAVDPTGREVALLLAAPERGDADASRRERLERAVRIQHVNVARIYEVGELENGSLYVILEKVGGEPLSDLLAAGHVLHFPEAREHALQVAAGLQAAYRAGFVHGNLWPGTILLTGDGDGHARITLIGFDLDPALGPAGAAFPVRPEASAYASPERLAGHPPDERSEVFSLGAILHHLLTGAPPEGGKVDDSILRAARKVLGTALAPDRGRRFHRISDFEAALERLAVVTGERNVPGRSRAVERGAVAVAPVALVALAVGASLMPRAGVSLLGVPPASEDQPVSTKGDSSFQTATGSAPSVPASSGETSSGEASSGTTSSGKTSSGMAATAPAPARSTSRAESTPRRDTLHARSTPPKTARSPIVARSAPAPRVVPPATGPALDVEPDADGPDAGPTETGMVRTPPAAEPAPATVEDRAGVYVRIGLDEASRQLGRPVHAVEGMSPVFYGLALSSVPPFSDSMRPVVRSVYMGPNESLILLDQQRVRPGAKVPALGGNSWRAGDVILRLHGDARPEVLRNLRRRVR